MVTGLFKSIPQIYPHKKVRRFRLGLFMTVGKRCVQETINVLDVLDDMCDSLTSIKEIKKKPW